MSKLELGSKALQGLAVGGSLVASFFLSAPRYVYGVTGLVAAISSGAIVASRMWEVSEPNEWLLLIENGRMVRAGIGLKCFVLPHQTVVKFPSKIERVSFSARNVTKEMQGLEITGFAIWSVNREGDGPFKCYKYTQGGDAYTNVQTMCESIVRHQIANHTLQEVLMNRNSLRDSMKTDLQKQLSGWGIWLETVEITDVQICSRSLFEDLQAEFRQDTHLKAEQIRLDTNNKVERNQLSSQFEINKTRVDTETRRIEYEADQKLKRQKQEATIYQQQCDLTIEKLKKDQQLQLQQIEQEFTISNARKTREMEADETKKSFDLKMFSKVIEVDGSMNPTAIQKYIVDSTERIYQRLPIKEISVNQYVGPENTSNISSLLPAIGMLQQAQNHAPKK